VRHERQKLFPPCSVAVCHHCRAAIHPCRGWMADSGQRDDLSSSVAKLGCLRGCRWTCVDRFRRITPGLSGERTDRPAQMRCGGWKALSRYETSSRTRGYTVTGIDRKSLHSNPHTCGGPGGGPGEVPPTCRCRLPRIVDSPIFVPDRASSTVGVGGLGGLAWSYRPVDEAARATWPGRKLRRPKQKQQRPT
jgi:hypothetical protein